MPRHFLSLFDPAVVNDDLILRSVCFLRNVTGAVETLGITNRDLPYDSKGPAPFMLFALIYGVETVPILKSRLLALRSQHSNSEIREKAAKVFLALKSGAQIA